MDTLTVVKFAQHRVNWMTVCQCYLGHTRASVYTSCEWPINAPGCVFSCTMLALVVITSIP